MGHLPPSDVTAFRVNVPAADEDVAVALLYGAGTTGIEVEPAAGGSLALLAYFASGLSRADLARALRRFVDEPRLLERLRANLGPLRLKTMARDAADMEERYERLLGRNRR